VTAGEGSSIEWTKFAPIPDAEGFAGSFAGVHQDALIVAGGANFPEAKPWEGGAKRWHDRVFVLERPGGVWRESGRLPLPLAYGVSMTTGDGLIVSWRKQRGRASSGGVPASRRGGWSHCNGVAFPAETLCISERCHTWGDNLPGRRDGKSGFDRSAAICLGA